MSLLKGTISRGEVYVIPFTWLASANNSTDLMLPPGAYDISFETDGFTSISSGTPLISIQNLINETGTKLVNFALLSPTGEETTDTAGMVDGTPQYFVVVSIFPVPHPAMVYYGIRLKYLRNGASTSGNVNGLLMARRR